MKKNIQVLVDLSGSMESCIGLVYLFLLELAEYLEAERLDAEGWTWQLYWFASGKAGETVFSRGKTYTADIREFLMAFRNLSIRRSGKATCPADVRRGWETAAGGRQGESWEQVVLSFSDYDTVKDMDLRDLGGVRRACLFLPQDSLGGVRLSMVSADGQTQRAIPVLQVALESLEQEWQRQDWNLLLRYLDLA